MAIQTETTLNVFVNLTKVDEIGISDTLDNYTDADIAAFLYVGANSRMLGGNIDIYTDSAGSYDTWNAGMPYNTGAVTSNTMIMVNGDGQYDSPAEGRYLGVVLLYPTDDQYNQFDNYITVSNSFKYAIVTEITPNNYLLDVTSNLYQVDGTGATVWTDTTNTLYDPQIVDTAIKYKDGDTYKAVSINNIEPYFVVEYGGYLYLIRAVNVNQTAQFKCSFAQSPPWNAGTVYYPLSYNDVSASISVAFNGYGFGTHISDIDPSDTDFTWYYSTTDPKYSLSDNVLMYADFNTYKITCSYYYINYHDTMMMYANSGLYFRINGLTVFKPLIDNNVVYDFTDDLTEASDIDNYRGSTKHDIPVTPPTPPTPPTPADDEDEDTAISTTGAPYAKGLVNYYAMTAGSVLIDHITEALSTWDLQNTGKDLYKNLVSCKLIKPPAAIPTSGSEPLTIYGEKPQYQGADITLPVVSGNPDATFGPYSISRKFNDFRDYAPYTRVCIFLPYCGWCDLPSHVVGKSVTVKYFTDIIAATVRAVVFCGNNIVAEAAGVMGLDIPFTADAVGMKQAGVVSGLTAYAGGALQTAAGVASIVTTKGGKGIGEALSGASKLVSAYTQTAIAFNENTTEISGKNGDGCCLSGATSIIIKIIRPKTGGNTTAPYVPAGFAHSVGFVSNKQVRVGNVSGLLIADNVDTSGIAGATDAERAEIKRVLETGLIVNAAPE